MTERCLAAILVADVNIGGDPEQEYFADGIVEEIITAMSRSKSLVVVARNSSFTYKSSTALPPSASACRST